MIKYIPQDTQVVFAEIPNEICLAINLSCCPHRCPGCHSPYLREDIGEELTDDVLAYLIKKNPGITCVLFMGGDNDIDRLCELAKRVSVKTAWYTGSTEEEVDFYKVGWFFDYIKVGPYIQERGPLNNPNTNQKLFKIEKFINQDMIIRDDITNKFWTHEKVK
jgi:anaerobic ribonucleoside-triphosphate reductase activating protein